MPRATFRLALLLTAPLLAALPNAWAQSPAPPQAQPEQQAQPTTPQEKPTQAGAPTSEQGFWNRGTLFGDPLGLRAWLASKGIALQIQETSEVFGNVHGGARRDVVYEGVTQASVGFDFEKLGLWKGGSVLISALQIHGRGASTNLVGGPPVNVVSNIEATRSTRLYDAYFEQRLFGDRVSFRIGQVRADDEFLLSQYGAGGTAEDPNGYAFANANTLFINGTFGLPALQNSDLLSGGPAYPLATPGARLRVRPTPEITLLAAVFDGNPGGTGIGLDPQARNRNGLLFPTRDGVLAFVEAQYALFQAKDAPWLPGTYRVGAWFHNGGYADARFAANGRSLADPAGGGVPLRHHGNHGFYGMFDQLMLQTGESRDQAIGVFARVMGAPDDRNLLGFYVNGGLTWKGPIPGREADSLGFGVAHAVYSDRTRGLDRDVGAFDPSGFHPVRNNETVFELSYQYQAAGWLTVQPDAQWILNPGGGVPDPLAPSRRLRDAFLVGLRAAVTF